MDQGLAVVKRWRTAPDWLEFSPLPFLSGPAPELVLSGSGLRWRLGFEGAFWPQDGSGLWLETGREQATDAALRYLAACSAGEASMALLERCALDALCGLGKAGSGQAGRL